MNNYFEKIKKYFGHMMKKRTPLDSEGIMPKSDWHIIISVTLITFCLICFLAWYIYGQVTVGAWFAKESETITTNNKIDQVLLKSTIDRMDAENLQTKNLSTPNDPSL